MTNAPRPTTEYLRLLARMFDLRAEKKNVTHTHHVVGGKRWVLVLVRERSDG